MTYLLCFTCIERFDRTPHERQDTKELREAVTVVDGKAVCIVHVRRYFRLRS